MRSPFRFLIPLFLIAPFILASCDSNGAMDGATATVTFNSVATTAPASKDAAAKTASHVDITEVKLLLKSITFYTEDELVENEGEEPSVEEDEDAGETFRLDPVVVTLIPGGDPTRIDVGELPVDNYDKVSFHIHKPAGNETPEDPDFAGESPSERYSIVVYGHPEGDPIGDPVILYRSTQNVVQEVDFGDAFLPDEGAGSAVTLEIDLSTWFHEADGGELDPSDTTQQNRSRIDRSIRNSFHVFQDDDEDGVEDAGEEG